MSSNIGKAIIGEFFDLIVSGATIRFCKKGADDIISYFVDIRGLEYKPQFSTDNRTVLFLRVENNCVVSEYSCSLRDAKKYFTETVAEERFYAEVSTSKNAK